MNILLYLRNVISTGGILFIAGFCSLILFSIRFMMHTWGSVTTDSLIYQLCTPMKGAGSNMFASYLLQAVLPTVCVAAAVLVILVLCIPLWDGVLPAAFAAAVAHIIRTVHRIKQTYLQLYAREYFAFAEKKQDPPQRV